MTVPAFLDPPELVAQRFTRHRHMSSNREIMRYRLFVPQPVIERAKSRTREGGTYPLVLFLHGAAARGTDNDAQLTQHGSTVWAQPVHQGRFPCYVLAPQCAPNGKWVDVDWARGPCVRPDAGSHMNQVMELLNELIPALAVDRTRVYACGQSMGAFGVWDLVSRMPATFAAAAALAGGGDPATAYAIKPVAMWAAHGDSDPVVPVEGSRAMINALRMAGAAPRYKEYPGRGHDIWEDEWYDPALTDWMFSHRKM